MAQCRRCGEEIFLARAYNGRYISCDAGLVPFWSDVKRGNVRVVTQEGDIVRCRLDGKPEEITNVGRVVHECRKKVKA